MTPRLTQELALLKRGEIPTGYKKTEFGIFPCDWETDKQLKDLGVFGKGKGLPGEKMVSSGVPCVGYGDIYMKYNYHFEEAQSFVDEETALESQPIEKGTLLFTGTGETAEEIGKCVCYNGNETIYAGGDIITFVSKEVNPLFLAYQQYQDFSIRKKAGFGQGHSVVHIQRENLERLPVAFPKSLSEQAKIAKILMTWDKAIELYKKQIEKLKQYKKICLKKMFPAKGQTVPEWRFKGFTGEWEKRKIGECFSERIESDPNGELISVTIDSGIKKFSELERHNNSSEDKSSYKKVVIGDIAYNSMRMWQGASGYSPYNGIVSPAYTVITPNPEIDSLFFSYLFKNDEMIHTFQVHSQGMTSDNWNLKFPELKKISILLPRTYSEQQTISSFFAQLDCSIALYQRKLEAEQKRRKALQQYLLNGIVRV